MKPKMKVAPGFPKKLPCVGWCGKMKVCMNPGDRKCAKCRQDTPVLSRVEQVSVGSYQ